MFHFIPYRSHSLTIHFQIQQFPSQWRPFTPSTASTRPCSIGCRTSCSIPQQKLRSRQYWFRRRWWFWRRTIWPTVHMKTAKKKKLYRVRICINALLLSSTPTPPSISAGTMTQTLKVISAAHRPAMCNPQAMCNHNHRHSHSLNSQSIMLLNIRRPPNPTDSYHQASEYNMIYLPSHAIKWAEPMD